MATIREATPEDYDAVCELFEGLDRYHVDIAPERFKPFDGPSRPTAVFRAWLEEPDRAIFVAEQDEALVGLLNCRVASTPQYPMYVARTLVVIENVHVKEELRRQGIGSSLLTTASEWAWRKGAEAIQMGVYCCNKTALAYSKKHSFSDVRTTFEMAVVPPPPPPGSQRKC